VGTALIVEFFSRLPERRPGGGASEFRRRLHEATEDFRRQVQRRYSEGTLQRLLTSPDARARRAALFALEMTGGMASNAAVAACLHDPDADARRRAADALWAIWFRGGSAEEARELRRLVRLRDRDELLAGLGKLIEKAPEFAEAYNQRAIVHYKARQFERSIADCQKALELNPFHFGAQAGMAQCYLNLRRQRSALKAFRQALRLNPQLDGVEDTIRALENALGEDK
jgi:tetratricopeptide (TPR) repeat protein